MAGILTQVLAALASDQPTRENPRGGSLVEKGVSMWAGGIYGSLLERHGDHILLSGGAKIFLPGDAMRCDFRVGTYLQGTYTELDWREVARAISPTHSVH